MPYPKAPPPNPSIECPDWTPKRTVSGSTDNSTTGFLVTGDHVVSNISIRVNKEWQPTDKAAQRWKSDVNRKLEQLLNNVSSGGSGGVPGSDENDPNDPGSGQSPNIFYDTGYFYIKCMTVNPGHTDWYKDITHNFGQVPTRISMFYTNDPKLSFSAEGADYRYIAPFLIYDNFNKWVGFQVNIKSVNTIQVSAKGDRLIQSGADYPVADGYFRVMLWK